MRAPSTAETNLVFPTDAELAAAESSLQRAFDAVERVTWQLTRVHEYFERTTELPDGVVVDGATLGRMYRSLSDFNVQVRQISDQVVEFAELLYQLDLDGRDVAKQRRLELES